MYAEGMGFGDDIYSARTVVDHLVREGRLYPVFSDDHHRSTATDIIHKRKSLSRERKHELERALDFHTEHDEATGVPIEAFAEALAGPDYDDGVLEEAKDIVSELIVDGLLYEWKDPSRPPGHQTSRHRSTAVAFDISAGLRVCSQESASQCSQ